MNYISLSWVVGSGENCNGGSKNNPTLDDILRLVDEILKSAGSVNLDVIDAPEVGPQSLQVEIEEGNAVFSLGEDDGNEYNIRTYTNNSDIEQKISILGNSWDSRLVCQNVDDIRAIIKEFVVTGNVSPNMLS